MRRLFTWLAIIVGLVWGILNIVGNLDEAQGIIANQSPTVKMLITLAASPPWWVPIGILAACVILLICLEFDLLPHPQAELSPFSTKIVRVGNEYRLRVGVKNTSKVKAVDTQITTVFWRCSGARKPFTICKSNANPISQDVPEQVELDFTLEPIEPVFVIISFAHRSRERGKLRQQRPSFYYRWSGSDSNVVHASKEERDVIIQRLKNRKTVPPAVEFHGDTTASANGGTVRIAGSPESWSITYEQETAMLEILEDSPKAPVMIMSTKGDRAGNAYAMRLVQVLRKAGMEIGQCVFDESWRLPSGINLWASDAADILQTSKLKAAIKATNADCGNAPRQPPAVSGPIRYDIHLMVKSNRT